MRWGRLLVENHRGALVPRVLGIALAIDAVVWTVVVATFEGVQWPHLVGLRDRAVASAHAAGAVDVVDVHLPGNDAAAARNWGLSKVATEWVVYLDADDELEAGYLDAMAAGSADVRAPAVRYVEGRSASTPKLPRVAGHTHDCIADCLPWGNWLIVGSMVRADMVRQVGGWRDFAWSEDWDLWLRCHLAGATFEAIPAAIYRAHIHKRSRNRAPDRAARLEAHRAIAAANGVPIP